MKTKPNRKNSLTPQSRAVRRARRNGSTVVEFALVVPLLLTMLIGIMEYGWLVKNNLIVANAAREGTRAASLGRSTTDITTRVTNSVKPLVVASPDGSIDMNWSDNNGTDNYPYLVGNSGSENNVRSGELIKITVKAKHKTLTGFFPFLRNRYVTAYATMRRE